eukprot:NODE_46_length_27655_cov_0.671796.p14 type:complete len:117 gc:universal NODE_46_length_27655_cov_0.671796:3186-3536(+)
MVAFSSARLFELLEPSNLVTVPISSETFLLLKPLSSMALSFLFLISIDLFAISTKTLAIGAVFINSWCSSSPAVGLSDGFFTKHIDIKSMHSMLKLLGSFKVGGGLFGIIKITLIG